MSSYVDWEIQFLSFVVVLQVETRWFSSIYCGKSGMSLLLLVPRFREDSAGSNDNVSVGASGWGAYCFSSSRD